MDFNDLFHPFLADLDRNMLRPMNTNFYNPTPWSFTVAGTYLDTKCQKPWQTEQHHFILWVSIVMLCIELASAVIYGDLYLLPR